MMMEAYLKCEAYGWLMNKCPKVEGVGWSNSLFRSESHSIWYQYTHDLSIHNLLQLIKNQ